MYTWSFVMTLPRCSGWGKPFGSPEPPDERHADDARPRLDLHADLQRGVSGDLHVLFPLRCARKARLAVARVTGRSRPALGSASDGEAFQQLAVQAHVELLRPAHALDVILV